MTEEVKAVKTDEQISKEAKKRKRKQAIEDVKVLCATFPKCFNLKEPKPLKVGISQEVFASRNLCQR